jgi:dihydropteroate synthase
MDMKPRHPSLAFLDKPFAVMGIINVTPDSFSDGGQCMEADAALARAEALARQGADILDIGGESTRPGAAPVPYDEECRRVIPVVEALARQGILPVSIDTTKASVARAALDSGAVWINDISAGRFDGAMVSVAAHYQCPVILMHSRKTLQTMHEGPFYADVTAEIVAELKERISFFTGKGVPPGNIILDPGIGFSKRLEDNIGILGNLAPLVSLGFPILLGASRKSFIGQITGRPVGERLNGSLASIAAAFAQGVRFFRIHDVGETVDFLKVLSCLLPRG